MTIQTSDNKTIYVADGIETVFSFGFKTTDPETIFIFLDSEEYVGEFFTTLNLDQDASPGGSVEITIPPPDGVSVTIIRILSLLQEVDYQEYDPFPAETHERALDNLTLQSQQQQEEIDRTLKSSIDTPVGVVLTLPSPDAGKGLIWNQAGDGLDNSEDDINGITTAAQNSANASQSSAQASAASAQEAAVSAALADASFDAKLDGFGTDGLHPKVDGDLDLVLRNSEYFISEDSITNGPVDFTTDGVLRTSMGVTDTEAVQVLYGHGPADKGRLWQRTLIGGVWDEWVRLGGAGAGSGVLGQVIYLPGLEAIPVGEGIEEAAGQLVSRTDYPQLWNAVAGFALADADWVTKSNAGANGVGEYSSGDLSTTFRLPDLRGEFIRGMNTTGSDTTRDPDRADDSKDWQVGEVGPHDHTATQAAHSHSIRKGSTSGGTDELSDDADNESTAAVTGSATPIITVAPSTGSESRPRNVPAIVAIVCLTASELVNLTQNPTGMVMQGFGPQTSGWLLCDGSVIPANHTNLIALVGANTPDLRGQFIRGWSEDAAVDPDGPRTAGAAQGSEVGPHNHVATQVAHSHDIEQSLDETSEGGDRMMQDNNNDGVNTSAINSAQPAITVDNSTGLESRPVNIAMFMYIKT